MKTIKLNLETYLTYYDKKEVIEVELEDSMVEALEALAGGDMISQMRLSKRSFRRYMMSLSLRL